MNVSELIRQKIWSGDVILLGASEHEIRQSLIMNLGIDPVRAQVFNCVRTEYVFFRCVPEGEEPKDINDEEWLYNQVTVLHAWNIDKLIRLFNVDTFEQLVALAMMDRSAYVCLNNMDDTTDKMLQCFCELSEEFGCRTYDSDESVSQYIQELLSDRYKYLFRDDEDDLNATTYAGTTQQCSAEYVFPVWLLGAKYMDEESQSDTFCFDSLFE